MKFNDLFVIKYLLETTEKSLKESIINKEKNQQDIGKNGKEFYNDLSGTLVRYKEFLNEIESSIDAKVLEKLLALVED